MDENERFSWNDPNDFRKLFDSLYGSLRKFLYYKSGSMEQAEDLAQESFLILWKKRENIDPDKVKSYLFTIANNLFLNEVKHQKVVLRFQKQPQRETTAETPQYLMEEEEFRKKLLLAIDNLPEKHRVVFLMNRIDKLTYREIADDLGLSVKAVEKRMHKALSALREINPNI